MIPRSLSFLPFFPSRFLSSFSLSLFFSLLANSITGNWSSWSKNTSRFLSESTESAQLGHGVLRLGACLRRGSVPSVFFSPLCWFPAPVNPLRAPQPPDRGSSYSPARGPPGPATPRPSGGAPLRPSVPSAPPGRGGGEGCPRRCAQLPGP